MMTELRSLPTLRRLRRSTEMEQQLETAFLHPSPIERAAALGIGAVGIGLGIFLAFWGISFLWRYTLPEIRLANPVVTVTQNGPLTVKQDKPFTLELPKIAPSQVSVPAGATVVGGDPKTAAGDVLKREVTVFWEVAHQPRQVVT